MVGHPVDVRRARFRRAMRGGAPGEVVGSNPIGSILETSGFAAIHKYKKELRNS